MSPYRNTYSQVVKDTHKTIQQHAEAEKARRAAIKEELARRGKNGAVAGFSVHKNPFDIQKSQNELAQMLQAVHPVDIMQPPVRPKEDPTICKSNFKTVETVTKVGHKNKPLGDWDVVCIDDAKKFAIE